jgi:hypothetical protein
MVTSSENVARLAVLIDADNAQPAVIEALRAAVAALTAVTAGSPANSAVGHHRRMTRPRTHRARRLAALPHRHLG